MCVIMHNTFITRRKICIVNHVMIKTQSLPVKLRDLLKTVPYANIATVCPDGSPWNTPVFVCFDKHMNMYWASWINNQHSINIQANPNIYVTLYNSNATEDDALAIYMKMEAKALTDRKDIIKGLKTYKTKIGETSLKDLQADRPRRLYRATPIKFWQNTYGTKNGYYVDFREEVIAL